MDFSPEQMAQLNRLYVHRAAMHEAGHALSIWYHDTLGLIPDNWPIDVIVVRPDFDRPFIIEGYDFEADGIERGGRAMKLTARRRHGLTLTASNGLRGNCADGIASPYSDVWLS